MLLRLQDATQTAVILEEAEELWLTEMSITIVVSYSKPESVKALLINRQK
jgi:hypothetical protein